MHDKKMIFQNHEEKSPFFQEQCEMACFQGKCLFHVNGYRKFQRLQIFP